MGLIPLSLISREVLRLISCFRYTPVLSVCDIEIKDVSSLHVIKVKKTIPEEKLKLSLDDLSEGYLLNAAYQLSIELASLKPIHTFNLPLTTECCLYIFDGISMRTTKIQNDYIFGICCDGTK